MSLTVYDEERPVTNSDTVEAPMAAPAPLRKRKRIAVFDITDTVEQELLQPKRAKMERRNE